MMNMPPQEAPVDSGFRRHALERMVGIPFTDGNRFVPHQNGDAIFGAMLDVIRNAKRSIDFLTFVYWQGEISDKIAEALAARAKDGLRVRVLLDAYGARKMQPQHEYLLKEAGCVVRWFRPLSAWRVWRVDKRTHRKVLVVDEEIGMTGGVGIASEWEGDAASPDEWRDIHATVEGPCVRLLVAAFYDNWNEAGPGGFDLPPPLPDDQEPGDAKVMVVASSATPGWTKSATVIRALVASARERIDLATAYFNPDPILVADLAAAAERGCRVRVVIPGPYCDEKLSLIAGRKTYGALLRAGVEIYRYQPTMTHQKLALVDDDLIGFGSANLNWRSMGKDEECNLVVLDRSANAALTKGFEEDVDASEAVELDAHERRGLFARLAEFFARIWVEQL